MMTANNNDDIESEYGFVHEYADFGRTSYRYNDDSDSSESSDGSSDSEYSDEYIFEKIKRVKRKLRFLDDEEKFTLSLNTTFKLLNWILGIKLEKDERDRIKEVGMEHPHPKYLNPIGLVIGYIMVCRKDMVVTYDDKLTKYGMGIQSDDLVKYRRFWNNRYKY